MILILKRTTCLGGDVTEWLYYLENGTFSLKSLRRVPMMDSTPEAMETLSG